MTRTGPTIHLGDGDGNIARARFCNRRHAALMVRIHADGSTDRSLHGISTLVSAWHRGWTDDIYARSLRAGRALQSAVVRATGAAEPGRAAHRPDRLQLGRRARDPGRDRLHDERDGGAGCLKTGAYQQRVALGLGRRRRVPSAR